MKKNRVEAVRAEKGSRVLCCLSTVVKMRHPIHGLSTMALRCPSLAWTHAYNSFPQSETEPGVMTRVASGLLRCLVRWTCLCTLGRARSTLTLLLFVHQPIEEFHQPLSTIRRC